MLYCITRRQLHMLHPFWSHYRQAHGLSCRQATCCRRTGSPYIASAVLVPDSPVCIEFSMGGKWLGLLKEVSPQVVHVAVLYHPQTAPYAASFLEPLQAGARALSVQVHAAEINEPSDVEREAAALPLNFSSGLIIIPSIFMTAHRDLIVSVAARYRMAAIYPFRFFASAGGLIAYGSDAADILARGILCGSRSQRRETWRLASPAADQVRVRHQPEDREVARARCASHAARAG